MNKFFNEYRLEMSENIIVPSKPVEPNLLQKSAFIHIPKTGGTFFREHFNEQEGWLSKLGTGHGNKEELKLSDDTFCFTFIREPVSWLISYWRFYPHILENNNAFEFQKQWSAKAIANGITWSEWFQIGNPIEVLWHENLNFFLARIREHAPNAVDLAYTHFTKGVDFIGKTENIIEDTIAALELAGEDMSFYEPEIIREWANDRRNVTKRKRGFSYDKNLMRDIIDRNPLVVSHY